jgi:hypothetical protein
MDRRALGAASRLDEVEPLPVEPADDELLEEVV